MRLYLIVLGSWLLLNLLSVLIVIPLRMSLEPKPLARILSAIKNLFRRTTKGTLGPAIRSASRAGATAVASCAGWWKRADSKI